MGRLSKLIKVSLIFVFIFCSVGIISGCEKDNETVEKTEQEKVYDLYVAYKSATGDTPETYEEWLETIKGDKGDKGDKGTPGKDGLSAYEIYKQHNPNYNKSESEWLDELVNGELSTKVEPYIALLDYFVEIIEKNDEETAKIFFANSVNDVLYENFLNSMKGKYYYEGVSNLEFEIEDKELFGSGKYQCYFSNTFENYAPKCDLENEGSYINTLINIKITYSLNNEVLTRYEKGLICFVNDTSEGNYLSWKLIRFDSYIVED